VYIRIERISVVQNHQLLLRINSCWLMEYRIKWLNRKSTVQVNEYGYGAIWVSGILDRCWTVLRRHFWGMPLFDGDVQVVVRIGLVATDSFSSGVKVFQETLMTVLRLARHWKLGSHSKR